MCKYIHNLPCTFTTTSFVEVLFQHNMTIFLRLSLATSFPSLPSLLCSPWRALTFFVFRKASHFSFSVLRPGKTLESLSLIPEWRRYRCTADARGELRETSKGAERDRERDRTNMEGRGKRDENRPQGNTKKRCQERGKSLRQTAVKLHFTDRQDTSFTFCPLRASIWNGNRKRDIKRLLTRHTTNTRLSKRYPV